MSKDDLYYEEPIDEICFTDYVPPCKDNVSNFCFTDEAKEENTVFEKKKEETQPVTKIKFTPLPIENNRHTTQPNGIPPLLMENFLKSADLILLENPH
nr:hypothetical protein [Clostridium paraputrificum]